MSLLLLWRCLSNDVDVSAREGKRNYSASSSDSRAAHRSVTYDSISFCLMNRFSLACSRFWKESLGLYQHLIAFTRPCF